MGMALGAKITVSEFLLNNLIPVTVSSLVREAHHLGATGPLFHSLSDAEAFMSPLMQSADRQHLRRRNADGGDVLRLLRIPGQEAVCTKGSLGGQSSGMGMVY